MAETSHLMQESWLRNTKSELGANRGPRAGSPCGVVVATSQGILPKTFKTERRSYSSHFDQLTLRLVAIAPSSDFVWRR
jgi:hypothetical protein